MLTDLLCAILSDDTSPQVQQVAAAVRNSTFACDIPKRSLIVDLDMSAATALLAPGSTSRTLPSMQVVLADGLRLHICKEQDDWEEVAVVVRVSDSSLSMGDVVRIVDSHIDAAVGHVLRAQPGLHTASEAGISETKLALLRKNHMICDPGLLYQAAPAHSASSSHLSEAQFITLTMSRVAAKQLQRVTRIAVNLSSGKQCTLHLSGGPLRPCCRRCGNKSHLARACTSKPVAPAVSVDEPRLKASKAVAAAAAAAAATAAAAAPGTATVAAAVPSASVASAHTTTRSAGAACATEDGFEVRTNRRRRGKAGTRTASAQTPALAAVRPAASSRNSFEGLDIGDGPDESIKAPEAAPPGAAVASDTPSVSKLTGLPLAPRSSYCTRPAEPRLRIGSDSDESDSDVSIKSEDDPTGKRGRADSDVAGREPEGS